ncbi:HTTM domain-containing protein [Actinomycetospora sp. NBRC 106378]|uniref:HTTM domain-containing protein n=1 Tax=Actinomycetospora sp. NBRC 106378 TaxID=3032208 RepID=UPI0024A4440A|nr:HTTM domain-containing protein [Actinomycetospora sp. NBRC 106378]GLZ56083.1 hypothetical protein Acsp07_57000 [Actinomycetospora sp. NBRC 106378]
MTGTRGRVRAALVAWNRFWFEPTDTTPLALFRIAFGVVATLWTLSHLPDLFTFLGPNGVLPSPRPLESWQWGLLNLNSSVLAVSVVWLATLLAAVALTVGRRPRLAAAIVFVGILSIERRNSYVLNNGDDLLRYLAFYLMLAPSGAALSLDRWRRDRASFWTAELRAPWALRLLQIQLSLIYVSTVWAKLQGDTWRNGTAVTYALRVQDITRFPPPDALLGSVVVSEWLTFGTLLLELSLGVLVWNRRARPYVIALGVLMHLLIAVGVIVGFFSAGMLCLYLVFLSPEAARRVIMWFRGRLSRARGRPLPIRDETGETVARST